LLRGVTLGAAVLIFSLLVYGIALEYVPETEARALAFIALVSADLALILIARSRRDTLSSVLRRGNHVFWWIVGLASTALALVISNDTIASLFRFTPPTVGSTLLVAVGAIVVVLVAGHIQRSRSSLPASRHSQRAAH
jgi:P-type Ca2+ transporter type 2C